QAVELYSQRFGPYPHKTLAAVMGDFNDGMEYSAFYFLPRDFYNLYDGNPMNYLVFVAAHETSHQWWFERVASDQAEYPWLDESLCTYSERLYYEAYHPDLVSAWWPYRMYYYDPAAKMDIPVYDGTGFQPYTNATYFIGAHFLEELRTRIGDEAFFVFLGDYAAQMDGKIATPQDFFTILRQHTSADFSDLIATYFTTAY
ncbi:MAG: M1 family aminopeptidase, partial [Anaerolineales bacterium]